MDNDEALDWSHGTVDLRQERGFDRQADDAQCQRISELFGEAQCRALKASYTIVPMSPGRYRVFGEVTARIEQVCGVTLDPTEQVIEEAVDVEFRGDARGFTPSYRLAVAFPKSGQVNEIAWKGPAAASQ